MRILLGIVVILVSKKACADVCNAGGGCGQERGEAPMSFSSLLSVFELHR
jgi:hypothetical protein